MIERDRLARCVKCGRCWVCPPRVVTTTGGHAIDHGYCGLMLCTGTIRDLTDTELAVYALAGYRVVQDMPTDLQLQMSEADATVVP